MSVGAPDKIAWYRGEDLDPPLGVRVFVLWAGREFEAARVRDPRSRAGLICWLTQEHGAAVFLPLSREAALAAHRRAVEANQGWQGWHTLRGENPEYWRPLSPETWKAPLPEAHWLAAVPEGTRYRSEIQRFNAVEEAEVSDLAREMEADREHARAAGSRNGSRSGQEEAPEAPPDKQWWLDSHLVTYSKPGSITPREAEGRLMRAFIAERWVKLDSPGWLSDGGDEAGPGERIEPNGRDQDDMLIALRWPEALGSKQQERVLRLRAQTPALTWRSMGQVLKISHQRAQELHGRALRTITAAANGAETEASRRRDAAIAAVRESNRRAKREGASRL